MITKKEIVELLNEYGGYVDRSRTEKAIHEDNFELIADAILSKLHQPTVIKSVCDNCRFKAECRYKEMNTEKNCKYFIDEQTVL
jgi:hypothetical protein